MNSTFRTTVLNIRFDTMTEEGRPSFDWANLHFLGEHKHDTNFSGVQVAKVRVTSENNNQLAKRLHALGHKYPMLADITTTIEIRQGKPELTVIDVVPAKV